MTSDSRDLVERLSYAAACAQPGEELRQLLTDARDEIERLRKAVTDISNERAAEIRSAFARQQAKWASPGIAQPSCIGRERARAFAIERHAGQLYGDQPYAVHLAAVEQVLADYGLIADHWRAAAWLHDVVEDTSTSIAEIYAEFGRLVGDLVWAVTGDGQTRLERNCDIHRKIAKSPDSLAPLKVADRIANVEAARGKPEHLERYRREQPEFAKYIKGHVPNAMWERLERALADDEGPDPYGLREACEAE